MKIYKFLHEGVPRFGVLQESPTSQTVRILSGSPFEGPTSQGEATLPLAGLELLPPTVAHPRIFGVGFNYKSHILETGKPLPEIPPLFMKPDTCLVGQGGHIDRKSVV